MSETSCHLYIPEGYRLTDYNPFLLVNDPTEKVASYRSGCIGIHYDECGRTSGYAGYFNVARHAGARME
jgi:hypothetical protein